jgi:hypothetical protein
MSIFGKVFDVVGDFGSDLYKGAKNTISGGFDAVGNVFTSGVGSGIGNVLGKISGPVGTIVDVIGIGGAIGNLVSDKDSGQGSPLGAFTGLQGAPSPVANTTGLGTGTSSNLINRPGGNINNPGSGQSFFPNAAIENQSGLIETNQSSIGNFTQAGFPLIPIGGGLASQAFQLAKPFLTSKASQAIGLLGGLATTLIDDDDDKQTTTLTGGSPMAFGVGGQGALTIPQTMPMQGSAFMSPVLGRIGISSRGNIIITRRLKNQFKALADNVGLAQASNLAGVPLEVGAMILTKRFSTRGKSISTKKMQECARTYKRITNFYNMIPRRTATRTTRAKTMRGASTVIQNS